MSATPPKRHKDGLIGRVEKFFDENPDEELTPADISMKFGVPIKSVIRRVGEAMRQGTTLECVRIIRRRRS